MGVMGVMGGSPTFSAHVIACLSGVLEGGIDVTCPDRQQALLIVVECMAKGELSQRDKFVFFKDETTSPPLLPFPSAQTSKATPLCWEQRATCPPDPGP